MGLSTNVPACIPNGEEVISDEFLGTICPRIFLEGSFPDSFSEHDEKKRINKIMLKN